MQCYDIKLGINTAQNSIGSYYSTIQKQVYKSSEITPENGNEIDIVYFGLGSSFASNVFVSPTESSTFGLANIPNATITSYTNKQENCGCTSISESQFDALTDDTFLQTISITNENSFFNNWNPWIIRYRAAARHQTTKKIYIMASKPLDNRF